MIYFNRRVEVDNHVFDSLSEAERYRELRLLLAAGEIRDLEVHPSWEIAPTVTIDGRRHRALRYTADFAYYVPRGPNSQQWAQVVEDAKPKNGYRSRDYRIRRHMMMAVHGIEVMEAT